MKDKIEQHEYIIGGGRQAKDRLNVLADTLQNQTKALLQRHGLAAGTTLLDVGCGGGNVSLMAADMVGHSGRVAAIDFDKEIIALAQNDAAAKGIDNVTFLAGSAGDMLYNGEFDMAYSRFLLSHLDNPLAVLIKMKQAVKPGGTIIVEDVDFAGHFCHPANAAFEQYIQYYTTAAQHTGANANIGPSLLSLFKQAGIENVGFDVIQPAFNSGPGKWMAYYTLERIQHTLVKQGIATAEAVQHMLEKLAAFTRYEQTIISLPRIFRVWGN